MDIIRELEEFLEGLRLYKESLSNPDFKFPKPKDNTFIGFPFLQDIVSSGKSKEELQEELREGLLRKSVALSSMVIRITGSQYFTQGPGKYDMWQASLNPRIGQANTQTIALGFCIDAINAAIGKLEHDIANGIRDKKTGELVEKPNVVKTIKTPIHEKDMPIYLFDNMKLHPKVIKVSESLFKSGNYASAILEAFKAVNNFVKEKSGLSPNELRGMKDRPLMAKVFDEKEPLIKLNELITDTDINEQEGFKLLFMGATEGIRNPKAHDLIEMKDPYKTLEYLAFSSLLLKKISFWKVD